MRALREGRAHAPPGWAQLASHAGPYAAESAFFAAIAFVAAYSLLARPLRSPIGLTIILLDLMIAITLFPGVLQYLFGVNVAGSEFFTFTTLGALAAVPLIIMWRFAILLRAQLRHRSATERNP